MIIPARFPSATQREQPLPVASVRRPTDFALCPGPDREKLRRVAKYQQWVIYALLAMIILYIALLATQQGPPLVMMLMALAYLAVGVFCDGGRLSAGQRAV